MTSTSSPKLFFARPEWFDHAACRGTNVNVFFPDRGDNGPAMAAKAVCASCPVSAECLDLALRDRVKEGVWGGKTEQERRPLRRGYPMRERVGPRCGTQAGYRAHRARGEEACEACLQGNRQATQDQRARQPVV